MSQSAKTAVLTDWSPEKTQNLGARTIALRHSLHERPMFDDQALASVLDRFPREELGVFTMGEDVTDRTSWRRGQADGLSGEQLLRAARTGRLWLNLRHANRHLPEYAALCEEIAAEKARWAPGLRTFNRDLGLLISSPNALVFYHLDVPLSSLWQVRGQKRMWLYPRDEPFVTDIQIERFVRREAEGQFHFERIWDTAATRLDLAPGDMVTWAQNAPYRVENGPMLNVSLSMEFMTPKALRRANVIYANAILRRRLGLRPKVQEGLGAVGGAKVLLAKAAKALGGRNKGHAPILPCAFAVEAEGSVAPASVAGRSKRSARAPREPDQRRHHQH